jgi:hypothetical protein
VDNGLRKLALCGVLFLLALVENDALAACCCCCLSVGLFSDLRDDCVVVTIDGLELDSFSVSEDDEVDKFESSSSRKNLGFEVVVEPGVGTVADDDDDGKSIT